MRTRRAALAAVVLTAAASAAVADPSPLTIEDFQMKDAADLVAVCDIDGSEPNALEAIHFCHGVIAGAYRVHEALARNRNFGRIVCPPEGTTRSDGARIFVTWMKSHPEYQGEPPIEALFRSWTATYPCPGK